MFLFTGAGEGVILCAGEGLRCVVLCCVVLLVSKTLGTCERICSETKFYKTERRTNLVFFGVGFDLVSKSSASETSIEGRSGGDSAERQHGGSIFVLMLFVTGVGT